jgi:hypothetical protein
MIGDFPCRESSDDCQSGINLQKPEVKDSCVMSLAKLDGETNKFITGML